MESNFKLMINNIKLWNLKVLKLKNQQEITKKYLTICMNNLQNTNEHLQQMEVFTANAHTNPKFINEIMDQYQNGEELSKSFPFMNSTLKLLSRKQNITFVYKLFEMINDPGTNSAVIWSRFGTSFLIKDTKGLKDLVQERFKHTLKTFYKTLRLFGFRCVDKFLCEYTNEHFQRDNNHMLKNIKSMRKILAVKTKMESDMKEEMKRLKFIQDDLKTNITYIKKKEQITKCEVLNVKRCLEIAQKANEDSWLDLNSVYSQLQAYETKELKQVGARQQSNTDNEKIKKSLYKLNAQILNLQQGCMFIEDQLETIERTFPRIDEKQEEVKLSINKLFTNPNAIPCPWKRSRRNEYYKKMESGIKTKQAYGTSESANQNGSDHGANQKGLTFNFEHELNKVVNFLMENDAFSYTEIDHDGLKRWIGILKRELVLQETLPDC